MSTIGLAERPGTEVLPMCSIATAWLAANSKPGRKARQGAAWSVENAGLRLLSVVPPRAEVFAPLAGRDAELRTIEPHPVAVAERTHCRRQRAHLDADLDGRHCRRH